MATALRKGPYQTNLLLAGFDKPNDVHLYTIDYFGAMAKVSYGAHGYASNFILSVLDRDWRKDLNLNDAIDVVKKCIFELKTRFLISQPNFVVKIVDINGIKIMNL